MSKLKERFEFLRSNMGIWFAFVLPAIVGILFTAPQRSSNRMRNLSFDLLHRLQDSEKLDFFFKSHAQAFQAAANDYVTIIYLDDESQNKLDQPDDRIWDRGLHATLITNLHALGAKAVVFDIFFRQGATVLTNVDAQLIQAINAVQDEKGMPVVFAEKVFEEHPGPGRKRFGIQRSFLAEQLSETTYHGGAMLGNVDEDGSLRKIVMAYDGYDTLPFVTESVLARTEKIDPLKTALRKEKRQDFRNRMWINFYGGPGTIANTNYWCVISNSVSPEWITNKVVFVGAKQDIGYIGTAKDEYKHPWSYRELGQNRFIPGVEVLSTVYLNLLNEHWLYRLPVFIEVIVFALFGGLLGLLFLTLKPSRALMLLLGSVLIVMILALILFTKRTPPILIPWLIPVGLQIPFGMIYSLFYNQVKNRLAVVALGKNVNEDIAKQIVQNRDLLKPHFAERNISIFFTDLRGSTDAADNMDDEVYAETLSRELDKIIACIYAEHGTVTQISGDSVMAIWNAPIRTSDYVERALKAALRIRSQRLNTSGQAVRAMTTRIGLHCEDALVGNFGSRQRFIYTANGKHVNLTARLDHLNKILKTQLLVTDRFYNQATKISSLTFQARLVGNFVFKGISSGTYVYEIIGSQNGKGKEPEWKRLFDEALEHFKWQRWDEATDGFRQCRQLRKSEVDDGPSMYYLKLIDGIREKISKDGLTLDPFDWQGKVSLQGADVSVVEGAKITFG